MSPIPWFKVDDTFHSHPKPRSAGLSAVGLWALAGSFAMAYKRDGAVPEFFVDGFKREGQKAAGLLVETGLWVPDGKGYQFHDWHDFQPSADEIELDREHARMRQRRRREKQREARDKGGETP